MKTVLCTLSLFLSINLSCFAQYGVAKKNITGIAELYFGMNKKDCINIIENRAIVKNLGIETPDMYIAKYVDIAGVLFTDCILRFYDDKMFSCLLQYMGEDSQDVENTINKLWLILTDKYEKYKGFECTDAAWKDEDDKIIMLNLEPDNTVHLLYSDFVVLEEKENQQKKDL